MAVGTPVTKSIVDAVVTSLRAATIDNGYPITIQSVRRFSLPGRPRRPAESDTGSARPSVDLISFRRRLTEGDEVDPLQFIVSFDLVMRVRLADDHTDTRSSDEKIDEALHTVMTATMAASYPAGVKVASFDAGAFAVVDEEDPVLGGEITATYEYSVDQSALGTVT